VRQQLNALLPADAAGAAASSGAHAAGAGSNGATATAAAAAHAAGPAAPVAAAAGVASTSAADGAGAPAIPRSIWVVGFVSMSLTLASCVFNTLLPIYMVAELRMTMQSIGLFEGLLDAFSYIVRMFSGAPRTRLFEGL